MSECDTVIEEIMGRTDFLTPDQEVIKKICVTLASYSLWTAQNTHYAANSHDVFDTNIMPKTLLYLNKQKSMNFYRVIRKNSETIR